jgi:ABC-type nitrate/sulfonate/bicarbonate transport system ATPase subunit
MAATATELRAAPAASRNIAIDIRGVSHAFELDGSRLAVLESIDLSVEAGEFVALLGPSGCGKSTLLRLISGLEQPTTGFISAEGSLIDRPDPSRILVFQDPTLFPWATVWNNVATGLDARGVLKQESELVSLWRREGFTAILVTHDVEEAVLLASRVIVLSERPGRIKAEFKVERPYPRHRDDPELVGLRRQILATLGLAT